MSSIDIVFLIVILISVVSGLFKGFVNEVLSLTFFVLAVYLGYNFYEVFGVYLNKYISKENIAAFLAFVIIFAAVLICGSVLTYFARKIIVIGPVKSADRMLGAFFGLIRGVLVAGIILYLMVVFQIGSNEIGKSKAVPYIIDVMDAVLDMLPEEYHIDREVIGIVKI